MSKKSKTTLAVRPMMALMYRAGAQQISDKAGVAMAKCAEEHVLKLSDLAVRAAEARGAVRVTEADVELAARTYQ